MRPALLAAILALPLTGAADPAAPVPDEGVWTNEEDRYFAAERGGPTLDWTGIEVADGQWRPVDAYGAASGEWAPLPVPGLRRDERGRWMLSRGAAPATEMRRGNPFTCWMAIGRFARKADGGEDLLFANGLRLHSQGGRVAAGGGDTGAPGVIFRVRDVVWPPPSTSKPARVLYVIKPEAPETAVAYSWADPDADLVGINLRWVQGSCSRDRPAS